MWRDLRRSGAIPLGQAVWAVPELPAAQPLLERLNDLVDAASGTLLLLSAKGLTVADTRQEEWSEFDADCRKYLAELDKEERLGKYTLAELEEEEQSLDRLRRWYRELRNRDLRSVPASTESATALKVCEERFESYAEQVYATLSSPTS